MSTKNCEVSITKELLPESGNPIRSVFSYSKSLNNYPDNMH